MTSQDLKRIYEYMKEADKKYFARYDEMPSHSLDGNFAWRCVQEMERKGDWDKFEEYSANIFADTQHNEKRFSIWLRNPDNFFNCMGKWLEGREK